MPAPGVTGNAAADDGWLARLELGLRPAAGRTVLHHRRRLGPLAVQRPFYPEGGHCHVYLLHPPGGIVGGDRLELELRLDAHSGALITTPGAGKFYRSAGSSAQVRQRLVLAPGSRLEWLPHEAIAFPGARIDNRLDIELMPGARLMAWELWCLGRPAIGEEFGRGEIDTRLRVMVDGEPRLLDRLRLDHDNRRRRALTAGQPVIGQMLLTPVAPELADALAAHAGSADHDRCGLTLLDELLVVRCLAATVAAARARLLAIWRQARESVIGLPAVPPRIWST